MNWTISDDPLFSLDEAEQHVCSTVGCNALTVGDRYCLRCRTEIDALNEMAAEREQKNERPRRGWNLSTVVYAAAVIAVEYYLLWEFRLFLLDLARMVLR